MTTSVGEIRSAAEALLGSGSTVSYQQTSLPVMACHSSVNNADHTEAVLAGHRQSGQMSVVRRFFCLFVTFDLFFTFFLWLICIMLSGKDIFEVIREEILRYNIHISLFDIVMSSIIRFTVLLLFYGLLYINHWFVVAVSTAGTCGFLIAKVFVYDWAGATQPVFQVLLILTVFVLSWGEAWFLDFRVIPQESQASAYDERSPLLRDYLRALPRYDDNTESVGNFYSPLDSPQGSDDEGASSTPASQSRFNIQNPANEAEMKAKAHEVLHQAWSILNSPDWRLEKETADGDMVHSKTIGKTKVFRVTGTVDFPAKFLLTELFYRIEDFPKWNPALKESQRIQVIDDRTDIYYQVASEGAGGIVTSRDFVNLRHWGEQEGCFVSAAVSIPYPDIPPHNKYIRGENGPNCWVMRPIPGEEKRCVFQWLLNTNLRGWIPRTVLDPAFTIAMVDYMRHLRNYSTKLRSEGAF